MTDQLILNQLQQLPDSLRQEVVDFIGYLLKKHNLPATQPNGKPEKRFGKYRGCLNTGLTIQEIDAQLIQLRNEWERPIS